MVMSAPPTSHQWAVVDVETTGLHPVRDRIVELAIIRLDEDGDTKDEWTTLVDPGISIRDSRIHGITSADVRGAPRFPDVIGEVLSRFAGHVLVAHNAPFD